MTDLLTQPDQLYQALLDRDPSYDGRAFVGVTSTGIFCRLTCPARKPKRENCLFFDSVGECFSAGFRPCKRCHPMKPAAEADPVIAQCLAAFAARPDHRWGEQDIVQMGFDLSTVRRAFQRHFGMTFLEMARQDRLRRGFETLAAGDRVIDAQIDAGYESPSAFRDAFARLLGVVPAEMPRDSLLCADWITTPLGSMIVVADRSAVHLLEFVDRKALPTELTKLRKAARGAIGVGRFETHDKVDAWLSAYFERAQILPDLPLVLHGTDFTKSVWRALQAIPRGKTVSYSVLANQLGRPSAVRAVARANGANQIALVIPCHRVIGADGALTGYGGGLWRKQALIELERDKS